MSQFTVEMSRFVNVKNILKLEIESLSAKRALLQSFIRIMLTGLLCLLSYQKSSCLHR